MAMNVGEVLGRLTGTSHIVAAILMKLDGSTIERSMSDGIDPETVGAVARDMFSCWEWAGLQLGMGRLHAVLLESSNGPLSMMPVGRDTILVSMGNRSCRIGRIRHQMQCAKEAIRTAVRTAANVVPDLHQILKAIPSAVQGGDEIVRAVEHVSHEELAEGSVSEVVVIGVNTFRLASRLVAALSQTQGVRSASLRAYSPGSLTIDVAFQEGGTLASITNRCFGDCSLDVIERTATRLVLAVSNPVVSSAAILGRVP